MVDFGFDPLFAAESALRMAVISNPDALVAKVSVEHLKNLLNHYASLASPKETIVAVACRVTLFTPGMEQTIGFASAPPPARHHNIIHALKGMTGKHTQPDDQGFLTSTGRYVERAEALQIALASGQKMIDHPSRHAIKLYSEDLW